MSEAITYKDLLSETEQMLNFGTWRMDTRTGNIEWSDGMYRLMGMDKQTMTESLTTENYIEHIVPGDRERFRKALNESLQENVDFEFKYTFKGPHREVNLLSKGKITAASDGLGTTLFGITKDITIESDFEQSLQDKVKELDRSNKELEEFAYIASHDLQEPLRKITSFSERLKEKLGNSIGPEGQVYLNRMLAATDNMRMLIDNLLEFSRTSRHSKPFEKTDINNVLSEVRADLELKIEETNAIIITDKLPVIEVIPSQIRQLLNNLVNNALKFRQADKTPHIHIYSSVASREQKEQFHFRNNKVCHIFEVRDNGIGFEQEYSHKIFQIFQRLHGKAEYPGSGIGLAICKKIVENHKGAIFANSALGSGSSFIFILPEKQI